MKISSGENSSLKFFIMENSITLSAPPSRAKAILITGLIAGSLDICMAIIVYSLIMQRASGTQILQGIAAGVFGKAASSGGFAMAATGLFLQYVIALGFATGFFLVYPSLPILKKYPVVCGLLYGVFVWVVMNLLVVPLSNAYHGSFTLKGVFISMSILMVCIGLPISLPARKYYSRRTGL
jgi:hypothetical protein